MIPVSIRQLYTPKQPAISATADKIVYHEFYPHENLQSLIYCYWQLKTTSTLDEPFTYRVVADGCIDIYFELNDPADNYVMGFCRKYTEFLLDNSFHYIGVRFLPTAFPQLFEINAKKISNRFANLTQVVPGAAVFIADHFQGQPGPDKIKKLFDNYFLKLLSRITINNDGRLYDAINIILQNRGLVDVEKELHTGISPRQLRRLFEYYVGDTAKTFAKVVRYQNILKAKPSAQSLRQNKLFFDAGYYDQAHFIKEFKNFYGVTPGKAFGR